MKSALYRTIVVHQRFIPKPYKFKFNFSGFTWDLEELDKLSTNSLLFSRNKFNFYSFYDKDHFGEKQNSLKKNVLNFLKENNVHEKINRVTILTSCRILGYVFNPVSYIFCYGEHNNYAIIEICNTFNEVKPYFVPASSFKGNRIQLSTNKNFYISPFADIDNQMTFKIQAPSEKVSIHIDDLKSTGELELVASLRGERQKLTDLKLLIYLFRFPLVTLRITFSIHWHALKLFLKRVPYYSKKHKLDIQQGFSTWK
jgi:DUF1365 family protein